VPRDTSNFAVRSYIRGLRRGWHQPLAGLWRKALHFEHVVAVTGSCGKSTTTSLIARILSDQGITLTGIGVNTARGIARNILRASRTEQYWVQEVSGHEPGAISAASGFLRHDIAVVTTVGMDHRKSLGGMEGVAAEKGSLVELLPEHGIAILNADDPLVAAMAARTRAKVVTFGASKDADIRCLGHSAVFPERLSLVVSDGERTAEVRTRLLGARWVTAIMAAIACGRSIGVELDACVRAVEAVEPAHGRDSLHAIVGGPKIVLDTVKAPWWTIASSLDFVRAAKTPRRTIVFGTISDYSGASGPKYRGAALQAMEAAERVVFVGKNIGRVEQKARENPDRLWAFTSAYQAYEFLRSSALPGELIYVKASGIDHLERLLYEWQSPIKCWIDDCQKSFSCDFCKQLHVHGRTRRTGFNPDATSADSDTGA
jgi:UDP-N-acetylmuramoyl-tripeptide--D-alanyl-D-alanine ligase